MKALLALLAIALAGFCAGACGGVGERRPPGLPDAAEGGTSSGGHVVGDEDDESDDAPNRGDDASAWSFGRQAGATDAQAIAAAVKRYYAAAARGDGAAACALILPSLAGSANLEGAVPWEYRPAPGSSILRGKDCPAVESVLFQAGRPQLAGESATLQVIGVRVQGTNGLALLGFRTTGERTIQLERAGGAWKIAALLDSALP